VVTIKPFTVDDLGFAAGLTGREGWASGRRDFELYLEHDPEGCFTAWDDDLRIGMLTTAAYPASGWMGNLIVVPEARSRGVGRALMVHGLARLEAVGVRTVRLDGDPPGIPLYRSLGFVDEWESLRFKAVGIGGGLPAGVEPLRARDLDTVAALDLAGFGDDRGRMLRLLLERAEGAFAVRRGGAVAGYLMLLRSDLGLRIGPCVAADAATAAALLRGALSAGAGEAITVGVPAPNPAARSLLERLGFAPTLSSRRMVRGPLAAAGRIEQVFAIANGAVG
jgi:ribosomal protein S18 acetylase RimI-like enzyme